MKEIWKFYKETNSNRWGKRVYYVSNYGRVKCNGELYKCGIRNGYYILCGEYLHRIIAEKFIPGWKGDYEIDHKDCNPLNNMVSNLLVCKDHRQNCNNPLTIQHYKQSNKLKALTKSVLQYTLDNKFIIEYVSTKEAERQTNTYQSNIVACCKHKIKSAGGYIWRYKKED